jgi:tRNA A-37 threonylcarbamoyl transferase component Bud32
MGRDRGIPLLAERYRLLSVVGRGGMGVVWRAHDEMLDRDVAVKEVRLPDRFTQGERRLLCRRLIVEARATAALRHPGVVDVHDVVIEDGRPWIVMELLRARSLHQEIAENGPLRVERAARIGQCVLSVLNAAHEAGILHRDVKPSNVLLCDDGRILLTDFGLAVHTDRTQEPEETLVAGIEGSPAYLPPERVRGEPGVRESDLWSLGATLYTAVEGRSPFLRCHALASMLAVLLGDYAPPVRAGRLTPIIEGLLRQDPQERLKAVDAARMLADAVVASRAPSRSRRPRAARAAIPQASRAHASWTHTSGLSRPQGAERMRRRRVRTVTWLGAVAVAAVVMGAWSVRWTSVGRSEALSLLPVAGGDAEMITYRESVTTGPVAAERGSGGAGEVRSRTYTVDVPRGWRKERRGGVVQWTDPKAQRVIRITPVGGDPLAGLRESAHATEAYGLYPGYRLLRLEALPGTEPGGGPGTEAGAEAGAERPGSSRPGPSRPAAGAAGKGTAVGKGTAAAEWEFTWGTGGRHTHVLRSRTAGYEFAFHAPDSRWTPSHRLYERILSTFRTE